MLGKMMQLPLLISALIEHANQYHGDTAIISRETDGSITTTDWSNVAKNSKKLANALASLGLSQNDCLATIAWNNHRHLETWYGVSGSGMICHTINPRLFPEQIIYVLNDAKDKALFFDKTFLPLVLGIKEHLKTVEHFICLSGRDDEVSQKLPNVIFYDDLIADASETFDWPQLDENHPSSLCYTSGTTGHPKGVLYSHRSTVLHSFAICLPDSISLSSKDVMMPVVPMFHVNAWGMPYAAAMVGCSMALPGPGLDGNSLVSMIDEYKATVALGVPTIWQGLLAAAEQSGSQLASMNRNVVGGSACPPSMIEAFRERYDCDTIHAWGMTETSPLGTANQLKAKHQSLSTEQKQQLRLSQGRPPFGVSIRIVDTEDNRTLLPNDGKTQGNLHVKGFWVVETYYGKQDNALTEDGWFDTGDIATINEDGFMTIRDRSKDLIKSGGEWISSVELENIAAGHPNVAMAAAIAVNHPRWDERPVLVIVPKPDQNIEEQEILEFFKGKIADWQIPNAAVFVESITLNGAGKMLKKDLREEYANYLIDRGLID